jgi:hypothetical protein
VSAPSAFARRCSLVLALLGGCGAPYIRGRDAACELVHDNHSLIDHASTKELYELARDTPAEYDARSAWAQEIAISTLGGVGAGALVVGLVVGFVTDPVTQPGARESAYAVGGIALGAGAVALILGFTRRPAAERARRTLSWWADRCR